MPEESRIKIWLTEFGWRLSSEEKKVAPSYELNGKCVRGFTGHDPCVPLHFHPTKWDLFNLNKAAEWQCQRCGADSQEKGQEVGADFGGVVTDLVGEASEQSMWLKHEGHKMKVNQESDYWGGGEVSKTHLGRKLLISSETGVIGKNRLEKSFAAWPCWGHCWSSWTVVHLEHERPGWKRESGLMRI